MRDLYDNSTRPCVHAALKTYKAQSFTDLVFLIHVHKVTAFIVGSGLCRAEVENDRNIFGTLLILSSFSPLNHFTEYLPISN